MNIIIQLIQDLVGLLGNANLAGDLGTVGDLATQILALLGDKNAQRDLQSASAYLAAQAGSVAGAQWLYHNSLPDSGMPHEDIIDGQFYWAKLLAAGWTVTNTIVSPPAAAPRPVPPAAATPPSTPAKPAASRTPR